MDIFSESMLERDGARAAAQGQSWRTNPFLQAQNMPQATGEPLGAWSCRHDAWQRGFEGYFQLGPEFARRRKEQLSAPLLRTLVERRLQWLPAARAYMAEHPRLLRCLPSPIRHERDLQGRNWDLRNARHSMTGSALIDAELRTIVDRLRAQYDLLALPKPRTPFDGRGARASSGGAWNALSTTEEAGNAGQDRPGTTAVPASLQPGAAPQEAPAASGEHTPSGETAQESQLRRELGIRRIGWRYEYSGYRYDRLADAVACARLDRVRQDCGSTPDVHHLVDEAPRLPSAEDRLLMNQWGIDFEAGIYRVQGYRYEQLRDAVAYASLLASRQSP